MVPLLEVVQKPVVLTLYWSSFPGWVSGQKISHRYGGFYPEIAH